MAQEKDTETSEEQVTPESAEHQSDIPESDPVEAGAEETGPEGASAEKSEAEEAEPVEAEAPSDADSTDEAEGEEVDSSEAETSDTDTAVDADNPEDDTAPAEDRLDDTPEHAPADDAAPIEATAPEPQIIKETVIQRKGGTGAMVFGGIIAAVLGYGAAQMTDISLPFLPADSFKTDTQSTLDAQSGRLDALETDVAAAGSSLEGIDLSAVENSVADATSRITAVEGQLADTAALGAQLSETSATLAGLSDQLAALDARLTTLEKAPAEEALGAGAIAAFEREFDALRAEIKAQQDEMQAQRAEVETIAADAIAAQGEAAEEAQKAAARAALAEVMTALETGGGFAASLEVLKTSGVTVPDALQAVSADGPPPLAVIAEGFPDASRAALAASRKAAAPEEGSGFGAFLQSSLGARSVTPREGNDPDAVLSRAEAALRGGDLDQALSELSELPEDGQAELADWRSHAETRQAALAAARALAGQLNTD